MACAEEDPDPLLGNAQEQGQQGLPCFSKLIGPIAVKVWCVENCAMTTGRQFHFGLDVDELLVGLARGYQRHTMRLGG